MSSALGNWELINSKDGSNTARKGFKGEPMHNMAGALSESIYVYGPALDWGKKRTGKLRVLVVGLGLGYLEFLTLARLGQNPELEIISFESDLEIRSALETWLEGSTTSSSVFEGVCGTVARAESLDSKILMKRATEMWNSERWHLQGALESVRNIPKADIVLFDPFSESTTPELWSESFLNGFLDQSVSPSCAFATYASKGRLNRLLLNFGFEKEDRSGFGGKRECTLAFREQPNV